MNGRVALYAGTGCITFDQTLELSNFVYGAGYKAPLVIGPSDYSMDQEGNSFAGPWRALAKKLHGDMYIDNYPARSGHCASAETIQRLAAANPNIVGLNEYGGPGLPTPIRSAARWGQAPDLGLFRF